MDEDRTTECRKWIIFEALDRLLITALEIYQTPDNHFRGVTSWWGNPDDEDLVTEDVAAELSEILNDLSGSFKALSRGIDDIELKSEILALSHDLFSLSEEIFDGVDEVSRAMANGTKGYTPISEHVAMSMHHTFANKLKFLRKAIFVEQEQLTILEVSDDDFPSVAGCLRKEFYGLPNSELRQMVASWRIQANKQPQTNAKTNESDEWIGESLYRAQWVRRASSGSTFDRMLEKNEVKYRRHGRKIEIHPDDARVHFPPKK